MKAQRQDHSATTLVETVESACTAQRALNAAEGRQARRLAAVHAASAEAARQESIDTGVYLRGIYADIGMQLGWSERMVSRVMNLGESLVRQLPGTLDSWEQGDLSRRHAEVIDAELSGLESALRAEIEQALLQTMADRPLTPARLRELARRLADTAEKQTMAERHRLAQAERFVSIEPARDGMAWLSVLLPAVDAVAAHQRTRAIAQGLRSTAGDRHDERTFSQVHADVVRDLLVSGACSEGSEGGERGTENFGHGVVAQVQVVVPVDLLIERVTGHPVIETGQTSELLGYGPIDPVTALELAASADGLGRILTDPATGQVKEVGRAVYRPPSALSRFIRARDQACRFPGCRVPTKNCEIDHSIDWQWGGPTDANNLACLCRRHHVMKHHTGWEVMQVGDDAELRWISPSGAVTHTSPTRAGPTRDGPEFGDPLFCDAT